MTTGNGSKNANGAVHWSLACGLALLLGWLTAAAADAGAAAHLGPYNVVVLEGGIGSSRAIPDGLQIAGAGTPWSVTTWLRTQRLQKGRVIVVAVGYSARDRHRAEAWRGLILSDGVPAVQLNGAPLLHADRALEPGRWYAVAATYDGTTARLYVDGRERASARADSRAVAATFDIAPSIDEDFAADAPHFGGSLGRLLVKNAVLDAAAIEARAVDVPDFSLLTLTHLGAGWPFQEHAWRGLQEPQDPWTLPSSRPSTAGDGELETRPAAKSTQSLPGRSPSASPDGLLASGADRWTVAGWKLAAAPVVAAGGAALSAPDYTAPDWYPAIVPGTVLTTLIANGVYPDPDYGLDNLTIPDSLSRQDYWYRTTFDSPAITGRQLRLTFKGINYAAEVWLNGTRLGDIRGAFIRGVFDVTGRLRTDGRNALAVRISPPPHPGIPHEQSIAAGPGDNGGAMAIDGPTFIAAEGWDWIPGIRDRNAGIWQGVELAVSGILQVGDLRIVTHLPLPRIDSADVFVTVPIVNRGGAPEAGTVVVEFEGVSIRKAMKFPTGTTDVVFTPQEFAELHVQAPRLWWPNGYGAAALYHLQVRVDADGVRSDTAATRFGIREMSYELSLFGSDGRLNRVEIDPTLGSMRGERLVDGRHEAINRTPRGWAASLTRAGEASPAVKPAPDPSLSPYLVIRVNGVRIAARGGSWGMDDSRKRISREHLEPYFRLHREAHLNIIRNWLGQNTEDVFYELADEYGLLILNDFWESTQDFQLESQDPALFLRNAQDVISRYRNHPSLALWFGRNEGEPQPILNEGLADLVASLDGTRYYSGSSNSVNLQGSGPYNYRPPEKYFTELAGGFSVEVGTPSLSTLESLRASMPAGDRWPISDTWAYHDWHVGGNGDTATFMAELADRYGAGTSLEDFERKAQLMNYETYRAIFEGFQARLWTRNSGRLLWMTHPAWPSNTWQIYSSDYDTGAAFYAVKKACEPVHAQLNLPDYTLAVANTSQQDQRGLTLHARVLSLRNELLAERTERLDAPANRITTLSKPLDLARLIERAGLVLVRLELTDAHGVEQSENTYWQGLNAAASRRLDDLAAQPVEISARAVRSAVGAEPLVHVRLTNRGDEPVLGVKATLLDEGGARVLPVYVSDNYVTLLPHESRDLEVRCPTASGQCRRIAVRGWNVQPAETRVD